MLALFPLLCSHLLISHAESSIDQVVSSSLIMSEISPLIATFCVVDTNAAQAIKWCIIQEEDNKKH
jgi:hypothetical protein